MPCKCPFSPHDSHAVHGCCENGKTLIKLHRRVGISTLFNLLAEKGRLAIHPMYTAKGKIDPTYIFRPGSIYAYPPIKRSPMLTLSLKVIAIIAGVTLIAGIAIGIYIATR